MTLTWLAPKRGVQVYEDHGYRMALIVDGCAGVCQPQYHVVKLPVRKHDLRPSLAYAGQKHPSCCSMLCIVLKALTLACAQGGLFQLVGMNFGAGNDADQRLERQSTSLAYIVSNKTLPTTAGQLWAQDTSAAAAVSRAPSLLTHALHAGHCGCASGVNDPAILAFLIQQCGQLQSTIIGPDSAMLMECSAMTTMHQDGNNGTLSSDHPHMQLAETYRSRRHGLLYKVVDGLQTQLQLFSDKSCG